MNQDPLKPIVEALVKEQRSSRRWGIFFKIAGFAYLLTLLALLSPETAQEKENQRGDFTAVIDISGTIMPDSEVNADAIAGAVREVFEEPNVQALILRINSPGGTPVQAAYINEEITRLKAKHEDIPVYAVIQDIGASGGYYVAVAADEIYAHPSSLVGSIGVTSSGFGFVGAMKKLGVERREYTSGEHKGFLDPFKPENSVEKKHWKSVLETTHRQFIDQVREGRGDRLVETPELYSGFIWSGEQALTLGLIDGLGSTGYVAREVVGEERIIDYTPRPSRIEKLLKSITFGLGMGVKEALGLNSADYPILYK